MIMQCTDPFCNTRTTKDQADQRNFNTGRCAKCGGFLEPVKVDIFVKHTESDVMAMMATINKYWTTSTGDPELKDFAIYMLNLMDEKVNKEAAYARRNEHHQISKLLTSEELANLSPATRAALKRRFAELNKGAE